jgi:type I restriction enzyme R subunit
MRKDKTIKKYTNRSVEAAQVIEELLELARKVREEKNRGKQQNMTDDKIAFYDALGANDSAVKILGDETLRKIALELTQMIRNSVTIDWTQRESVQAITYFDKVLTIEPNNLLASSLKHRAELNLKGVP